MSIVVFENKEIIFKKETNDYYVSGFDVCEALDYKDPINAEQKLYGKYKDLFEPRIINCQVGRKLKKGSNVGRPRIERYYNQVGATLLIMKSGTEKAELLQIFIAECFIKFINGETKPLEIKNPLDLSIITLKEALQAAEKMREVNTEIKGIKKEHQMLENEVEENKQKITVLEIERSLTPSQRGEINRLIRKWAFEEREKKPEESIPELMRKCYSKLQYHFDVDKYNDISSKKFPDALDFLYRKFRKQNNKKIPEFY